MSDHERRREELQAWREGLEEAGASAYTLPLGRLEEDREHYLFLALDKTTLVGIQGKPGHGVFWLLKNFEDHARAFPEAWEVVWLPSKQSELSKGTPVENVTRLKSFLEEAPEGKRLLVLVDLPKDWNEHYDLTYPRMVELHNLLQSLMELTKSEPVTVVVAAQEEGDLKIFLGGMGGFTALDLLSWGRVQAGDDVVRFLAPEEEALFRL